MSAAIRVLGYLQRYWFLQVLVTLCLLAVTALNIVVPLLIRIIIDNVLIRMEYQLLLFLTLAILGIAALRGVLSFAQRYTTEYIAQKVVYDVRNRIYEALQRQSFTFYDKMPTGQLMSRVTSDVDLLRGFLAWGFPQFVGIAATFIGVFAIAFSMSWKLTLLALSTAPILFLITSRFARKIRPIFTEGQERLGVINAVLQENITGVKVVRTFAKEDKEERKFMEKSREYFNTNVSAARLRAKYIPLMEFVAGLGTVLILLFGGIQVVSGEITIGTLVAFNTYLLLLLMPMRFLGFITAFMQRALAGEKRIFEVLDAVPEIKDKSNASELDSIKGHVRFEDVSFSYGQEPVLNNVAFEAKPGETVALLGATGSGKSSVINLIPRFYDVTAGKLTIDGLDVRDLTMESLRQHIGIVHQETFLFSTTIRENIAYGRPDAAEREVVEAAKAVGAHDFIMSFAQDYGTNVGERGIRLSMGQRQLISFARALLADPRILILDEATSSVDAYSELLIQNAMKKLLEKRTTIIIAHRLSTVRSTDKIVVIDEGRIVDLGTHEELMNRGGLYRKLYEMQLKPIEAK